MEYPIICVLFNQIIRLCYHSWIDFLEVIGAYSPVLLNPASFIANLSCLSSPLSDFPFFFVPVNSE